MALLAFDEDSVDSELMATLKKRRTMLNWHTYTAWATVGLLGMTLISDPDDDSYGAHQWLGIASGVTYLTSASLAYFAPRPDDVKLANNIQIHKKLVWIHAPAMLLTAVSAIQALNGQDIGKKWHPQFAALTAISLGLAAVSSMDWTLNFYPTSKKEIACLFSKSF